MRLIIKNKKIPRKRRKKKEKKEKAKEKFEEDPEIVQERLCNELFPKQTRIRCTIREILKAGNARKMCRCFYPTEKRQQKQSELNATVFGTYGASFAIMGKSGYRRSRKNKGRIERTPAILKRPIASRKKTILSGPKWRRKSQFSAFLVNEIRNSPQYTKYQSIEFLLSIFFLRYFSKSR
jgi:hypothetical protein